MLGLSRLDAAFPLVASGNKRALLVKLICLSTEMLGSAKRADLGGKA